MRCEKFGCKRNLSWLGFDLTKLGGLAYCGLVAKLEKKWSHGFRAILVGKCHKFMQNEVWKFFVAKWIDLVWVLTKQSWVDWLFMPSKQNWWVSEVVVFEQSFWGIFTNSSKMRSQKFGCKMNWSLLGFGLAKLSGLAFFALVAKLLNKWSHGFWTILVGNCHKCIPNEVSKVWLQKEFILVGFWLSQVGWIGLLWLGSKIGEKVKSWFSSNLGGELSQMHPKWGVKRFVAKGIDLGWVLA